MAQHQATAQPEAALSRLSVPTAWSCALIAYAVVIYGGVAQGAAAMWITDMAWTAASLLVTIACAQAALAVTGHLRTAWILFAAAFGIWFIGQLIWDWYELVRGVAVPFPSPSDAFYTAYGLVAVAALFALREPQPLRPLTVRNLGNLGLIICSLAVALTTALLEPLANSTQSPLYTSLAVTEALVMTTAFVFSVYFLWSYIWGSLHAPLILIVLGLAVHGTVALVYVQALLLEDFGPSHYLNVLWLVAFAFQHWAAREQICIARGQVTLAADRIHTRERRIEAVLPSLLLLMLVAAAAWFHEHLTARVLAIDAALLGLFAIILLIRESWMHTRERELKSQLGTSYDELDQARATLGSTLKELHEAETTFRLAASLGNVGLFRWDVDSRRVQYSAEWKRQLGHGEDEIRDDFDEWQSRLHPDDLERALGEVTSFMANPSKHFQLECRLRHKDGTYRWIFTQASLQRDEHGRPAVMIGSHVDITKQKQIEAALRDSEARHRDLASQLELRVAERTQQLKDAYQELEGFAYAVAHDLKTPLRAIDGFSHLLLESAGNKLDAKEGDYVDRLRRAALRMAALIDGLLAYSRVERRELQSTEVRLQEVIGEIVAEYDYDFDRRKLAIERQVPDLTLQADREGLVVILRNLFENAVKFTRDIPQPRIELGARTEGDRITLWVKDNGIGFDERYHDQIFRIFQRLHRNEEYEGTGIGLALARKAVQRMNGRLWAQSSVGQGATFYVELPMETRQAAR